ncbi:MAG TPA: hypothetical protein VNB64_02160 [Solirubrobacteraceae bacterium]|nr:hypothetical protein [Solirubrobacteraceae bacterium]
MRPRRAVAVAVPAALLAAAPAPAAIVSTPESCYSSRELVDFVGTEFRPGRRYTAYVAGREVATGRVSAFGDLSGDFRAPVPARGGPGERTFLLTVTDGVRRASTRFRSTIFGAAFRPAQGDPATLRVRFYAFDFGRGRTVYLHYVAPNRRLRLTVRLGRTGGPCGTVSTPLRRVFPFPAAPGSWRLQFDARRRYDPTPPRPYVRLIVPILRNR